VNEQKKRERGRERERWATLNPNRCQKLAEFKGRGQLIILLTQFAIFQCCNLAKILTNKKKYSHFFVLLFLKRNSKITKPYKITHKQKIYIYIGIYNKRAK